MRSSLSLLAGGAAAALVLAASTAFAHIDLLSPTARYVVNRSNGGGGSKSCPCGGPANVIDPNRICDVPAAQSHDSNRSSKITTFEAGSQITLRMEEYINHSGRFRVAFDPDGADMTDFNSNILMDVADNQNPQIYEFTVRLPNMPCENCTLQVIQDMNGNTTTAVRDPSPDSTYYTCADIRLVAPGTMGTDDGTDDPEETPPANPGGMGTDPGSTGANTGNMGAGNMGSGNMGSGNTGSGTGNMGTGNMGAGNTGTGTGTNLGTLPMMGDNTAAGTPTGTGTSSNGNTSTGVGSLMPGMGTGTVLAPSNGAPIMSGGADSSDSGGGCSIGARGTSTPVSPFAALAVVGMFGSLAARRRSRRAR